MNAKQIKLKKGCDETNNKLPEKKTKIKMLHVKLFFFYLKCHLNVMRKYKSFFIYILKKIQILPLKIGVTKKKANK